MVADEARTLARRTQEATTQFRKQFESMVSDAAAASSNMDNLSDEGEKGVQLVKKSATAFTRIARSRTTSCSRPRCSQTPPPSRPGP